MKVKAAIAAVLTLSFACCTPVPVSAQEATPAAPAEKKKDKGGLGKMLAGLPGKAAAFTIGAIGGTPIAIVRVSARETVSATRDLVGETSNPLLLGAAGVLGVPAGVLSGALQGPVYGMKNSWDNLDEPFSKDAFSLGEIK
jgi:hypothetical protein